MPTYVTGRFEYSQAWEPNTNGTKLLIFGTEVASPTAYRTIELDFTDDPEYGPIYSSGVVTVYIHDVYDWDTSTGAWVLNTFRYTEQLKSQLNSYKRELLNDPNSTVTLVNPDTSEVLGVETDQATTFAVKMQADLAADKTPIETDIVGYHFDVFTPVDDVDIGSRDVTTKYLKNLLFKLNDRTQKHFRAENHVMQLHGATPYTDHTFAIPKADLLDYVNTP